VAPFDMRTNVRSAYDRPEPASTVVERVVRFVSALRAEGAAVSTGETVDAIQALHAVDLADRPIVRAALCGTLVKGDAYEAAYDRLFDAYFPRLRGGPGGRSPVRDDRDSLAGLLAEAAAGMAYQTPEAAGPGEMDEAAFREALARALRDGADDVVVDLASSALDRWGGIREGASTPRHHTERVLRRLDLDARVRAMLAGQADQAEFDRRVDRAEALAGVASLRALLEELAAARLPTQQSLSRHERDRRRRPDIEDVPILKATRDELIALRAAVRPLARRLATRVGRRHRKGRGRLDMRRTIRRSMSTGGVPIDPVIRRRVPTRPDLVVLCDVSGSVATFVPFMLSLLHALHDEFPRVRSWVFVDGVAEITEILQRSPGVLDPRHLLGRRGLIAADGRSDYARALRTFIGTWPDAVTPRTTVLIVGDARSHDRQPALEELAELRRLSRRLYWLNPEPCELWGTTDSLIDTYRHGCAAVHEVRALGQLADVIAELI
jgi:uncharacterized protein with von Willebrand factor type A (vWA) domain